MFHLLMRSNNSKLKINRYISSKIWFFPFFVHKVKKRTQQDQKLP